MVGVGSGVVVSHLVDQGCVVVVVATVVLFSGGGGSGDNFESFGSSKHFVIVALSF